MNEKEELIKRIEEAKDDINSLIYEYCDNYCQWASEYKDPDDLFKERCDTCRLMELKQ